MIEEPTGQLPGDVRRGYLPLLMVECLDRDRLKIGRTSLSRDFCVQTNLFAVN